MTTVRVHHARPRRRPPPGIVPDGDVPFSLDPEYIPFDKFIANF